MEPVKLNRRQLYDLVWSESLLSLSKKFAISDVGLRKACLRMNVPLPPTGYWSEIQHGQHPPISPFPEQSGVQTDLTLHLRDADHPATIDGLSPQAAMQQRIEKENTAELIVHNELFNPDPLITAAQKSLAKRNKYYREGDMLRTGGGELNIRVTATWINRALCLMDAVIKVLRKRGYTFVFKNETSYIVIEDEQLEMTLRETTNAVESSEKYTPRSYVANGKLELKFDDITRAVTGRDGKVLLEEQLSKVFARLELMVEELVIETKERKIRQTENAEKERLRKLSAERKGLELDAFKQLLKDANDWQQAVNLRHYIEAAEQKAIQSGEIAEETRVWLNWAKQKADWYDPLTKTADDWLTDADRLRIDGVEKPKTEFSFFEAETAKTKTDVWPLLPWYLKK